MTRARKTAPEISSAARKPPGGLTSLARGMQGECLAQSARKIARRLTAIYDRHLEPHELSLPQFGLMAMIAGAKDDTLAALAEIADIDPSTLTRNLQSMEKLGLVEVAAVEADQRKRSVWLTETGARKLAAAIPAWDAAQAECAETLGAGMTAAMKRAAKSL
jgi:DNA-binding MarR family transcriptional regulator